MQQKTPDRLSSRVFVILCVYCPSPRFFNHSVFHKVVISFLENFFKFFPRIAYPAWETQWISVRAVAMFRKIKSLVCDYKSFFVFKNECRSREIFPASFCLFGKIIRKCKSDRCAFVCAVVHVDRLQTVHYVGVFIQKFH